MAKKCMIERELKRQLTVDKFKKKRQIIQKSLKKAANLNEIFALQRQLQRLPVQLQ